MAAAGPVVMATADLAGGWPGSEGGASSEGLQELALDPVALAHVREVKDRTVGGQRHADALVLRQLHVLAQAAADAGRAPTCHHDVPVRACTESEPFNTLKSDKS